MKTLFITLLVGMNAFAVTNDVCVLGQVVKAEYKKGNLYCLEPGTTKIANSVIARCSYRADNITNDMRRATLQAAPGAGTCGAGLIPHEVLSVVDIAGLEQAQADVIATLLDKGYSLFDSKTLVRTR